MYVFLNNCTWTTNLQIKWLHGKKSGRDGNSKLRKQVRKIQINQDDNNQNTNIHTYIYSKKRKKSNRQTKGGTWARARASGGEACKGWGSGCGRPPSPSPPNPQEKAAAEIGDSGSETDLDSRLNRGEVRAPNSELNGWDWFASLRQSGPSDWERGWGGKLFVSGAGSFWPRRQFIFGKEFDFGGMDNGLRELGRAPTQHSFFCMGSTSS